MAIPEVVDAFERYTTIENIPPRFIDLEHVCLVDIEALKQAYRVTIESIEEADIERHTSYANQRREDVVRMLVQGVVKYAILSHTWLRSDPEFLFRDMVTNASRTGAGWCKLEQFCDLARGSFGCRFAWADTACIDYTHQPERQSLTQFLFDWFRNAYVCIAHLASASDSSDMHQDEWFRRGFTLTEILAPTRMKFYGAGWKALNNDYVDNDKADGGFLALLSEASGLPANDLRTFWPGPDRIRHKLLWASRRETTEAEDKAYSLMAMFGSSIKVNYGEGERAFARLMINVISHSGECDAFAWAGPCSPHHPGIPLSPVGFGHQHRDQELNATPHHYRLCGDRSLSIDFDHLRIRVIILKIALASERGVTHMPVPLQHSATLTQVTLLHPKELVRAGASVEMAVGVVDYTWTGSPDEGKLVEGDQYFCFLLYKSSTTDGWRKLMTEKVVFLTNEQELVEKLSELCIYQANNVCLDPARCDDPR